MPDGGTITFAVASAFLPYVEAALVRFGYLYPDNPIRLAESHVHIKISAGSGSGLRQEFLHLLYRERIYAETLPIRRALYGGLGDD